MKKITLFLAIALSSLAFMNTAEGQSIQQLNQNYFVAGIPSNEFEFYAAAKDGGRQRQTNWCWAACVQMVLNYHGLYITQEQIVAKIYGGLIDQPANSQQIMAALSGWAPNVQGTYSQIYCQAGINSANEITQNLGYKWPLIVGLKNPKGGTGHAYVLTAIYYSVDAYNNTVPDKVVLRDPWPNSPSRQEISWNEFRQRAMAIFKIKVSR